MSEASKLELSVTPLSVERGDIAFRLVLKNMSAEPMECCFRNGLTVSVEVKTRDGERTVFNSEEGAMYMQSEHSFTLEPGEERRIECPATWETDDVQVGEYVVEAMLHTTPKVLGSTPLKIVLPFVF